MTTKPPRITIVSFSPIQSDARVLRQVEYLSRHFAVTVIGYGLLSPMLAAQAQMIPVAPPTGVGLLRKLYTLALLPLGRLAPRLAYPTWYWSKENYQAALPLIVDSQPDLILADDWHALPVAVRAAEQTGAVVVLDLHEYFPLQYANRWHWRAFRHPMVDFFLRKHQSHVARFVTVGKMIADKYEAEYRFSPTVVMNAPKPAPLPVFRPTNPQQIRLIHHGAAVPDRKLELMIEALAQTDPQFTLHLMLVGSEQDYIQQLKDLSQRRAPGRIFFLDPVPPAEIVQTIAQFDMGIFILPFTSFSYQAALPNKFFDFLAAGLAVCIGPSPEMANLVRTYSCGLVADSFDPAVVARALNSLRVEQIDQMKQGAREASKYLNADSEMGKLLTLCNEALRK